MLLPPSIIKSSSVVSDSDFKVAIDAAPRLSVLLNLLIDRIAIGIALVELQCF